MAFLGKIRKNELVNLGIELGLEVDDGFKVAEIKTMIIKSADYDEEYVKALVETIVEEREAKIEQEKRDFEMEKEKEKMKFELEKIKLENTSTNVVSNDSGFVNSKSHHDLQKIIPKFDPKEDEISFYLVVFERQVKKFKIEKKEWVSHLLGLLPPDIVQLISRESEEKCDDYDHIKDLLLRRFKLSPETFRIKFVQHQKATQSSWRDYAFELSNFFEEWIDGVEATDFQKLKELIVADQMKKRVSYEVREHFVDCWGKITSPTDLANMLDEYENVRRNKKGNSNVYQEKKKNYSNNLNEKPKKFISSSKVEEKFKPQDSYKSRNYELFDKRRSLQCYECGSSQHLRPQCPKLKNSKNSANINRIYEGFEEDEYLTPYTTLAEVNGYQMPLLRDTGASIDIICRKFVAPEMYTGEKIWIQQPLDEGPKCLPLAQIKISFKSGEVRTKAAVVRSELDKGRYIMGNRTASLLSDVQLKEISVPCTINAVQTRAQAQRNQNKENVKKEDLNSGNSKPPVDLSSADEEEKNERQSSFKLDSEDENLIPSLDENGNELSLLKIDADQIVKLQTEDPELRSIFELAKQRKNENETGKQKFVIKNGLLLKIQEDHIGDTRKLIVIPKAFRSRIMALCHENTSGHLGVTKTKDRLGRYFFWPKCYKEVEDYVRSCDSCQKAGKPNEKKKAPLKLVPVIQEVFSKLNIDACGPLPTTPKGNRFIITSICLSSKYPDAIPVTDLTSISVTDALLNIFSRTGFPVEVQHDQGMSFMSNLTTEFLYRLGIKVSHSSVYHPQSNPVERFHRTVKRILRVLCIEAGCDWEKHLPSALFALRTVTHESTGFSPAELVHGKQLRTLETLLFERWTKAEIESNPVTEYVFKLINRLKRCQELAIQKMEETAIKRKRWYDKNSVKREFKEGDKVLVLVTSPMNKLSAQWQGPGTIESQISNTNYVVNLPGKRNQSQIYHVNLLKPYYSRTEVINLVESEEMKDPPDLEIEFPFFETNPNIMNFFEIVQKNELKERLSENQISALEELLHKYSNAFSNEPGLTNLVQHDIELVNEKQIRARPYRLSPRQNEILKREINKMLKNKIIEVGVSDYTSPMILVEVQGKEPRPCIDYRKLNKVIKTEYYPLPNIEERIEQVSSAKFITVLDLSKGYWQIPLTPKAQKLATFVTSFGSYQPLRMPFGLKNAPYFFSKMMTELLQGAEEFAVPYLDDIAIFSKDWKDHLKHLNEVLKRISKANLKIKPSKCAFAQEYVKYLGHVVGQGKRSPSDIKIQAIEEFPTPTSKTQIRAFLGLAGYYQRYIPRFSVIAAPLTEKLKGTQRKEEIEWTPECETAFKELKRKLSCQPVLHSPDYSKEFLLQTDASDLGIGVVLSQKDEKNDEHPILYLSRKFSDVERKFGTTEKECAAIVWAIKKLHCYLDGQKFEVQTDHDPLVWLRTNASTNPRLMRWALALQPFAVTITHRSGKNNKNADSLSRA